MTDVLQPGMMRLTVTATPTGVLGHYAVHVIPDGFPGGWEQVFRLTLQAVEVAAREWAATRTATPTVPLLVIPDNGEQH